jgi:hypothetical protein
MDPRYKIILKSGAGLEQRSNLFEIQTFVQAFYPGQVAIKTPFGPFSSPDPI